MSLRLFRGCFVCVASLFFAIHCATALAPSDDGTSFPDAGVAGNNAVGNGDGDGDGDGDGGSSGAAGASGSAGTSAAGTSAAGTSSAGTSSAGMSSGGASGGQPSGGGGGASGGMGGMATAGTSGGGAGGAMGGSGGAPECQNAGDCDDMEECTDDDCDNGTCTHVNNTAACTDDGIDCTNDVCSGGMCTHGTAACDCDVPSDCEDFNACTDEDCVDHVCTETYNTAPCTPADTNPCTDDVCDMGACGHPPSGLCTPSTIVILSHRDEKYVKLIGDALGASAPDMGTAELFEKVEEVPPDAGQAHQFKLQAKSTGMFVTIDAGDALVANTDQAGAMVFESAACVPGYVSLVATGDDSSPFVAADNPGPNYPLISRSGDCGGSWEQFALVDPN